MRQESEKNRLKKNKPHKAITSTECMKVVKIDIDFFWNGFDVWKSQFEKVIDLNSETSARKNFI